MAINTDNQNTKHVSLLDPSLRVCSLENTATVSLTDECLTRLTRDSSVIVVAVFVQETHKKPEKPLHLFHGDIEAFTSDIFESLLLHYYNSTPTPPELHLLCCCVHHCAVARTQK